MLAKCIICKKEFEQKGNERKCEYHRKHTNKTYAKSDHTKYMKNVLANVQNPIYQWYYEFITTEIITGRRKAHSIIYRDWI